jgi:hypothetical protein
MTAPTGLLAAARAEALFVSDLSTESHPTSAEVTATIRGAVRAHGGSRGCATILAGDYGEHPETAASRMRWALGIVHAVYAKRGGRPAPTPWPLSTGRRSESLSRDPGGAENKDAAMAELYRRYEHRSARVRPAAVR